MSTIITGPVYGIMAEFEDEHSLLHAAREAYKEGYRNMDAYSPIPVLGLPEAIGAPKSKVPLIVLIFGLTGAITGWLLQYWVTVIAYPLNVGGKPLVSWPMWVPIIFELMILFGAFSAFFGMLALNRLPEPYHPVFNVPGFERASQDRFFLCIEAKDPKFDRFYTREFLKSLGAVEVSDVAP